MVKSPFLVVQNFISPLQCEEIIDDINLYYPNFEIDGTPVKTIKSHRKSEETVFSKFTTHIPYIEQYYDIKYHGTEPMLFELYPQECKGETTHCENGHYVKGKWVKTSNRDFSCVVFLCDYQEKTPFDHYFEVYGGKLEFPQWGFGFNPQRGTLIIFPSDPHFLNNTTPIIAGNLYQIRFHIVSKQQFVFKRKQYPGNYEEWFEKLV